MSVRILIDSPLKNTSIIYITGYSCLDPVVIIDNDGDITGFFPATELERAKKHSKCNNVRDLSREMEQIISEKKYRPVKSGLVLKWLNENRINEVVVPESFPVVEADYLRESGIIVTVHYEPFYPERLVKDISEISFIKENSIKNVKVMDEVRNIIASSSVSPSGDLIYQGVPLTSEYLQSYILKSFLDKDLTADTVIVAHGNQGCDPHEPGYGNIKVSTGIIIDIFPKSRVNSYYSDMTRTFCKWKAGQELSDIYQTVKEAQLYCLDRVRSGVSGSELHEMVVSFFTSRGYKSGVINGVLQGFFHGTGHGVGLDCHEGPYISRNGRTLLSGSLVTVEPGLYYLDKGAVRIEDLVVVQDDGCENLTNYPKELIVE